MFTKKKAIKKVAGSVALVSMSVAMLMSSGVSASALTLENKGKYYSDYSSLAEAKAAADELNTQISAEGNVLLKNDGTLPLFGNERISVFGAAQDSMVGASGSNSVTGALKEEGFIVNPALEKYYAGVGTTIGTETSAFSKNIENSLQLYNDAAVVILSRTGGEGSDLNTGIASGSAIEKEDNKDGDGNAYDWEHESLAKNDEGENVKHYLELTDSEEAMISFVKKNFKKIIVLVNTSNAMELGNLNDDAAINAILWIGRPGSTGIAAMAQILNGKVNPSGKLVDEWYRDFTADPTWQNFGNNTQVGSLNTYYYADGSLSGSNVPGGVAGAKGIHGIDYEEDIYLGYRYYETVYAEILNGTVKFNETTHKLEKGAAENKQSNADAYWNYAVVYPFGYGLSYTNFSMELGDVYYKNGAEKVNLPASLDGSIFASEVGKPATAEKLYAPVTVTNNGNVAGKQVVQVYVTAPYINGGIERAAVDLVGYAKTDMLKPGESQTVTVEFNVQDFAAFDYDDANGNGYKGYELDPGAYSIKVMEDSHRVADSYGFEITSTNAIALKIDDFSHNEVKTWFSNGDAYDTLRINDENHLQFNVKKDGTGDMVLLSRSDMVGTFPKAPTEADLTVTDAMKNKIAEMDAFDADNLKDESSYPWYKSDDELKTLMKGWTQASEHATDYSDAPIKLADMAGVDIKTPEGAEKWKQLMNQLTWTDIANIVNHGSHTTYAIPAIDKTATSDENGPNSYCGKNWCDETVVSSTWNVDLGEKYGIINANLGMFNDQQGWYGPGMNIHRSPFAGRNNEYYSQDGIQGGYMAAAVVGGAQSRGLNVYIKHMFINDQETHRNGECLFTWASERVIRDVYAKNFQMAMQEGGATSAMTAFARLGRIPASADYNFLTGLVREEWAWEGQYVTDAWAGLSCLNMDIAVRTGNDLPDGTASKGKEISGTWKADAVGVGTTEAPSGNVVVGSGESTKESLLQWYYARVCAERVLYVAANTQNNHNGVKVSNYKGATITGQQGVAMTDASVAMNAEDANGGSVTYTVTKGSLPEGLSLNASTGAITGTPLSVGSYQVTVTAAVDGWVTTSAQFTLDISSAFNVEIPDAKVGEAFEAFIDSEVVTSTKYTKGITYTVAEGALPAGLELLEDSIVGTPTEAGTYEVTIRVSGTYEVVSGRRKTQVTDNYLLQLTIVVAEGEGGSVIEPETGVQIKVEDGYIRYSNDGETWTNIIAVSELKGEKGDQGEQGPAGGTAAGADVQIKVENGYICYSNDGETWTNLISVSELKGEKGDKGDKGDVGPQGAQGEAGKDAEAAEGGCGSAIGLGSVIAATGVALAASALVLLRKKND